MCVFVGTSGSVRFRLIQFGLSSSSSPTFESIYRLFFRAGGELVDSSLCEAHLNEEACFR